MNVTQKNFYTILGVIGSAESAVIKAAYKALMMIYHPDRYDGDKKDAIRKSKEINEAYAVLIDLEKRKKYDLQLLNKTGRSLDTFEIKLNKVLNEFKVTLKDSEEILKILKAERDLDASEIELNTVLNEFKNTLKDSEEILKILNEPD